MPILDQLWPHVRLPCQWTQKGLLVRDGTSERLWLCELCRMLDRHPNCPLDEIRAARR